MVLLLVLNCYMCILAVSDICRMLVCPNFRPALRSTTGTGCRNGKRNLNLSVWCITGGRVPVIEQQSDIKQEELSDHPPVISNGLSSETPALENAQCDESISNLYKRLDDKVGICTWLDLIYL